MNMCWMYYRYLGMMSVAISVGCHFVTYTDIDTDYPTDVPRMSVTDIRTDIRRTKKRVDR